MTTRYEDARIVHIFHLDIIPHTGATAMHVAMLNRSFCYQVSKSFHPSCQLQLGRPFRRRTGPCQSHLSCRRWCHYRRCCCHPACRPRLGRPFLGQTGQCRHVRLAARLHGDRRALGSVSKDGLWWSDGVEEGGQPVGL